MRKHRIEGLDLGFEVLKGSIVMNGILGSFCFLLRGDLPLHAFFKFFDRMIGMLYKAAAARLCRGADGEDGIEPLFAVYLEQKRHFGDKQGKHIFLASLFESALNLIKDGRVQKSFQSSEKMGLGEHFCGDLFTVKRVSADNICAE